MRFPPRLLAAVPAAALLLAACGDDAHSGHGGAVDERPVDAGEHADHGDASPVAAGARRIEVTARSFAFDPDEITVSVGEEVAIVLTSIDIVHDFTIDELDAHLSADADETVEGGLRADEAGRYTFYCSVPGHQDAGMEGTLVVES